MGLLKRLLGKADKPASPTPEPGPSSQPAVLPDQPAKPAEPEIKVTLDGGGEFRTLAEAVAGAPAGATLRLSPGAHRLDEPLEINKPLTLVGAGIDKCQVIGRAHWYVVRFSGSGAFAADGIEFRHQGGEWASVVEIASGEITLDRCRFTGGRAWGALDENGMSPLMDDLERRGLTSELMNPLKMMAGEGMRTGSGLWVYGKTHGVVRNCAATGNQGDGIALEESADVQASDNRCFQNERSGLFVTGLSRSLIRGNICRENGESGIAFHQNAAGQAIANRCESNGLAGIAVLGAAQPVLECNICEANKRIGIAFLGEATGMARENEARRNVTGIYVGEQARPELKQNQCERNQSNGITFDNHAKGVASQNRCLGNGANGIEADADASPTLSGNTCQGNAKCGILFFGTSTGMAEGNSCIGNSIGLAVQAPAQPTLRNNTCSGNRQQDVLRV